MSKPLKIALLGIIGLVFVALFVPGFSQFFNSLLRDSETVIVPASDAVPGTRLRQ